MADINSSLTHRISRSIDPMHGDLVEFYLQLPGVEDASAIHFSLGEDSCTVEVPGIFPPTDFSLGCLVDRSPLTLRFIRKKHMLKVVLKVAGGPPSPPGSPPASPTVGDDEDEGEDLDMYAFAREQANRESAEIAFQHAQDAIAQADYDRAVRLMKKALQLDPTNSAYQGALKIAMAAASARPAPTPGPPPPPQPTAAPSPAQAPQQTQQTDEEEEEEKQPPTPSAHSPQPQPSRARSKVKVKRTAKPTPTPAPPQPAPEPASADYKPSRSAGRYFLTAAANLVFAFWVLSSTVATEPETCPEWMRGACVSFPWVSVLYTQLWAAPTVMGLVTTPIFGRGMHYLMLVSGKLLYGDSMVFERCDATIPVLAPRVLKPGAGPGEDEPLPLWMTRWIEVSGMGLDLVAVTFALGGGKWGAIGVALHFMRIHFQENLSEYLPFLFKHDFFFGQYHTLILVVIRIAFYGLSIVWSFVAVPLAFIIPNAAFQSFWQTVKAIVGLPFVERNLGAVLTWLASMLTFSWLAHMLSCYNAYDWPDRVRKIWVPIAGILHLSARPLAILAWEPFFRWYCRNNWEFVLLYTFLVIVSSRNRLSTIGRVPFPFGSENSLQKNIFIILEPPVGKLIFHAGYNILFYYTIWSPGNFSTWALSLLATIPKLYTWSDFLGQVFPCARINAALPITLRLLEGGWRSLTAVLVVVIAPFLDAVGPEMFPEWYKGSVADRGKEICTRWPALLFLLWGVLRHTSIINAFYILGGIFWILVIMFLTDHMHLASRAKAWLFAAEEVFVWGTKKRPSARKTTSGARSSTTQGGDGSFAPGSGPVPPMMEPMSVPKGANAMVRTILEATNHYDVLDVGELVQESEIRKVKRTLSLATHPDKVGAAPGAAAACQRVLEAAEVLLDAQRRKEYEEAISQARFEASGMRDAMMDEMLDKLYEETGIDYSNKDSALLGCDSCARGVHQVPLVVDRTQAAARWCKECGKYHPAEDGEHWVESSFAWDGIIPGSRLNMYIALRGKVYDASELGECQGVLQMWVRNGLPCNTHTNLLHNGAAPQGGGQTPGKRERKKGRKGRR